MKHVLAPQLVALSEGVNIALEKPIVLIGRHQECDIQIPSRKISRRHCCIALVTDHLVVRDLGSTNGIRINGIKVVEGNLLANDELTIGNMLYQVKWGGDSGQTLPASAKQAIKAAKPPKAAALIDESLEVPMALPDLASSHPVLQGKPSHPAPPHLSESSSPKTGGDYYPAPGSLEIPDSVGLAPLDPPSK